MRHLRVILIAVLAVALIAVPATMAFAATKRVSVKRSGTRFTFSPSTVSIKRGDTVRWSWSGAIPHNVSGPGFRSRTAAKLTYSRKFSRAGTFRVVCTLHQAVGQRMTVRVS
jgi:plastocyanin